MDGAAGSADRLFNAALIYNKPNKDHCVVVNSLGELFVYGPGLEFSKISRYDGKEDSLEFLETEIALFLMRGVGENTFQL